MNPIHIDYFENISSFITGKPELQDPIENLSRQNTVSYLGKNVLKKVRQIETSISCLNHSLYHKANMGLKWSYQKDSGSSDSMEQDSNYSTCNSMNNEDDVKDNSNDGYSSVNDFENNQEIHLDNQEKGLNSDEDKVMEKNQILGTDHTDALVHATDGDSSFNASVDSVSKEVCKIKLNDEDLILTDHEDDLNNDMHLNIGNRHHLMEHSGCELIDYDNKPRKIENRGIVHDELSFKMTKSSEMKCGSETNNHKGCPTYRDFKTDELSYTGNHNRDSDLNVHCTGPFKQISSINQHEESSNVSHGHEKLVRCSTVTERIYLHENKIRRYSHGDRYSRNSAHPHVSNRPKLNNTSHREDSNWLKDHDVSNEKESQRNTSHASSNDTSLSEAPNVPFNHEILNHSMTAESTILSKDHEASSHHAHRTTANRTSLNVKHPNEATNHHERSMHSLTVESYQHEPRNRSYSHGDRYLRTNTFRDGILAKDHFRSTDLSKDFDLTRTSQQNHPTYMVEEQRLKDHSVSQTYEHQRKISHVSSVTKPHKETDVSSSTKPHKETHVSSSTKPHKETHVSSSTKPHKETHVSSSTKPHKETHVSSSTKPHKEAHISPSTKPQKETSNAANDQKRSMLTVTREETRTRRYSHGDRYQRNSTSSNKVLSGDNFGSADFSMDLDIPKSLQQNHPNYMVEEKRLEDHSTTQKNEHSRKISHVSSNNTSHKGTLNAANDQKHSMLTVTRDETRNRRYSHGDRYQRSTTFHDSGLTTENFRSTDFSVDPPVTTVSQQNHTHNREDNLTLIQRRRTKSSSNDGSFSQELSLRNQYTGSLIFFY